MVPSIVEDLEVLALNLIKAGESLFSPRILQAAKAANEEMKRRGIRSTEREVSAEHERGAGK